MASIILNVKRNILVPLKYKLNVKQYNEKFQIIFTPIVRKLGIVLSRSLCPSLIAPALRIFNCLTCCLQYFHNDTQYTP